MTPASFGVQSMWNDADRVWKNLPDPQQAALVGALEATRNEIGEELGVRIRGNVHARVAAALRTAGLVEPLDSDRGRRDLTLPGLMVRDCGLEAKR